ncbi:uncharacterized protein NECHADRAFT_72072 [Fusarium vanettenii 77-13-4]|uniref:GED domain-containing protein n=1 Tax=Fusarium vanettenii (strain ATCC MYA-4622 / CBS 123669 / FGSC 9596 / NRRL 45880 / 77-13-4) TaxID=660122 RepID=C7YUZ3_FUSV7|nr:uncharacterized protein NECHADRAFT_72072 [Fusarium vanettenii 77-13-4]EEU44491.1 hypothetical protein NECHADRAFT_72072 [Fusarium vanettenii 77-13-4]
MAGPVDITSQVPQTPPQKATKSPNNLDPKDNEHLLGKSPADSGVWDMSGNSVRSPSPSTPGRVDVETVVEETPVKAKKAVDAEVMPEDPFENPHNRILFDAIDKLQSFGSRGLRTPQLVIVGGQSSGKSSLLQSLTGIPFPVNSGCCTRWPTRIVSRRTGPGSKDSFRITIEPPDVNVPGMEPASEDISSYSHQGNTLTKDEFVKTIDEVSDRMGISPGTGRGAKNFASEVFKIELSGPNRSYFSILDLPGTFNNAIKVNEQDPFQVETMTVEYMKNPDNIVICVLDAPTDFVRHDVFTLASRYVSDQERLVGVFTKCDMIQNEPDAAEEIVDIATSASWSGSGHLQKGWFLVRNRAGKDGDSFDLKAAEESLFSTAPWDRAPKNRLGSTALKTYLGHVLSSKIRDCFPELCAEIESTLNLKVAEKHSLGEPRDTHAAKQQYAMKTVDKFKAMADLALDRPEELPGDVAPLLWEVSELNQNFDDYMRIRGGKWELANAGVDPFSLIAEHLGQEPKKSSASHVVPKLSASLDKKFPNCSVVHDSGDLLKAIEAQLAKYQAAQLPGIINPVVYPKMYQMQVEKWEKITHRHLFLVREAIQRCYMSILDFVCPSHGETNTLRKELENVLERILTESYEAAEAHREGVCGNETKCKVLQTTAPRFGEQVLGWRQLRFFTAMRAAQTADQNEAENLVAFVNYFQLAHPSLQKNMVNDVHDVLKVYYEIALDAFIRNRIQSVFHGFVNNEDGPIKALNTEWVMRLGQEELDALCREDERIIERRSVLGSEIDRLRGALAIVDKARQQTAGLEKY